ncbi:MAG TPA: SurA N-terminal domain-containing protein [Burkholderiales bacterium]|nr:SurA N-terminal domain-containing protein [Burkholderiales bacterium]
MYDFVAKNKKLIQVILAIIFLPFAFFGIDQYFRGGVGGQAVARVGDYVISGEEFSRALREQQDQLRRVMDGRVDPAMLDNAQMRSGTLESLIQRRLLLEGAVRAGLVVSDQQLDKIIAQLPEFQDGTGKFSAGRAEEVLRAQGMRAQDFRARLRQDLLLQQLAGGLTRGEFVPRSVAERLTQLTEQQREVAFAVIAPEKFAGQVKLDAEAARKYYDANPGEYRIPQQARVEYVALSTPALMQQVQVSPADVKQFYESNRRQFEVAESRQASHIFISADGGEDARSKARAQAQEIYQEARKKPGSFADLAKKHSQDPGSAARGGDLGFLPRGVMKDVPEFEDALYKLKAGEISPPVESKLGYHIIRLTKVQPAQGKSFEEMRPRIEADLKRQAAAKRFAEAAEAFGNAAYEQSESLKPAAEVAKTAVQTSGWLTRESAAEAPLNNPRLLAAIFSDESFRGKRNTEAIEVAPGVLVAARVIEHKPEGMQPFDAVREALQKRLILREAGRVAAEEGRRLLAELQQGKPAPIVWSASQMASVAQSQNIPEAVLRQAFRADVSKLPAYSGVENLLGGYTLVRVTRVQDARDIPPQRVNAVAGSLRQVLGQETLNAYVGVVRQKAGVTINKEQLEKKSGDR